VKWASSPKGLHGAPWGVSAGRGKGRVLPMTTEYRCGKWNVSRLSTRSGPSAPQRQLLRRNVHTATNVERPEIC